MKPKALFSQLLPIVLLSLPVTFQPVAAEQSTQENANVYHFAIGDIAAVALSDGEFHGEPQPLYAPTASPAEVARSLSSRGRSSDRMPVYFTPLLLDIAGRKVLIDGGAGRSLGPALGHLAERLQQIGVAPSDIDDILVTHGHLDHVGGLFDQDGHPVFPNAVLRLHEEEYAFWSGAPMLDGMLLPHPFKENFRQTAAAALDAYEGRTDAFAWGEEVTPGITAIDLSGHTPGHAGFVIRSGDAEMVHVGDLFFDEAFDLAHPDWRTSFDNNAEQAAIARRAFLARAAEQRTLLFAYHIAFPGLGFVEADGKGGYRWRPALWQFSVSK